MNDTREHIIHIAFGLFLQKSYKEVTMKDIVEKTGLSKGAFYHYFESKEQLFLEIAEQFIFSMFGSYYRDMPEDSFQGFYRKYLKNINAGLKMMHNDERFPRSDNGKKGPGLNYFTLIFDAIKLLPEFQDKIRDMEVEELAAWRGAIAEARKRGEIRSAMNDEQLAKIFIYTNDGIAMRILLEGSDFDAVETQLLKLWDAFYADLQS